MANFYRNGILIAQARVSSGTTPRLPCLTPQLRDCSPLFPDSALVASQCRSISKLERHLSLAGSISLTIFRLPLRPRSLDLSKSCDASPPPGFVVGGTRFTNFGFGLPVADSIVTALYRSASCLVGTSTSLTVPFPTTQGLLSTLPGLSVGGSQCRSITKLGAAA